MAIAKYYGDTYGVNLTFNFKGPSGTAKLLLLSLTPDLVVPLVIENRLLIPGSLVTKPYVMQVSGGWTWSTSQDQSVSAKVEFRAADGFGLAPGTLIYDSGWIPDVYLAKYYGAVTSVSTVDATNLTPTQTTDAIVAAADTGATSIAVESPTSSYTVDVSSTTEAAVISGMSYADWINLYTYGTTTPGRFIPGAWQIAGPQMGRTLMGSASGQGFWR